MPQCPEVPSAAEVPPEIGFRRRSVKINRSHTPSLLISRSRQLSLLLTLLSIAAAPMASPSGSGEEAVLTPPPGDSGEGEAVGGDAPLSERWGAQKASEAAARAARASAALAAHPPDDGSCPSRPAAPELPPGAWAVIMDRAASCRCVRTSSGSISSPCPDLFPYPAPYYLLCKLRVKPFALISQCAFGRRPL